MAKNDSLEQITLVPEPISEPGGPSIKDVQYLRKDTHMLVQGTWFIALPCPYHDNPSGLVDEEVSWAAAKTPHHAGVLAELRHVNCNVISEAHELYLSGLQEIEAAKSLRNDQVQNLKHWQEKVEAHRIMLEADPLNPVRARELAAAEAMLKRHEHGMLEAEKRVQNTVTDNER